ncbi:hypothetical protein CJU89_4248 [Yarrowia sp. B02]|nr:hypothetical protein CJU89_4248 [Yarrowia sp. B02]
MPLTALPVELLQLVISNLPLSALCALAQTCTAFSSCPVLANATELKSKDYCLDKCPWFRPEPTYSSRESWKECALEHLRRKQPGAKFARSLKQVRAEDFGPVFYAKDAHSVLGYPVIAGGLFHYRGEGYMTSFPSERSGDVYRSGDITVLRYWGGYDRDGTDCGVLILSRFGQKRTPLARMQSPDVYILGEFVFLRLKNSYAVHWFDAPGKSHSRVLWSRRSKTSREHPAFKKRESHTIYDGLMIVFATADTPYMSVSLSTDGSFAPFDCDDSTPIFEPPRFDISYGFNIYWALNYTHKGDESEGLGYVVDAKRGVYALDFQPNSPYGGVTIYKYLPYLKVLPPSDGDSESE